MRKIHRLDLDFAKDIRTQRKITFKEQDSITLYMSIYNDGVPVILDNQTPRLFIKKSDGTILYQTEVLSIQNNVVAFDVHRQATTCPGLCYAEVEFIEDEELITTRSFVYIVEPKVGSIENAIASVDEAYFLKIVEDFIAQAKLDIAEFRDAVASLENRVNEADDKLEKFNEDLKQADLDLNEAKENALEEISDLRYEAIDDIQEARDEGIDTITILNNETVQIIDQIKGNSINLIIDEKDNSIKEMAGFKDACLEAIELLKNGTINMIYQAKNDSINEINDTVDRHLTTIRNNAMQGKADIINLTKTSKEEITGLTNESKEAIEALRNEVIDNIDDYTIEHIEELEAIIDSLLPTVGEARELETSLINLKESLIVLKDALQKLNADGLLLNDKLEVAVQMARTTQNELLTAKNEAISVKVALNQVIATTESLKDVLLAENERAEANIEELNTLHPEADIRIETLRNLIEEAKRYEEVVRVWIANREPAEDLTEVNRQLEELYKAVELLDVKFNSYYTKEEVDELVNNAGGTGGAGNGASGIVGNVAVTNWAIPNDLSIYENLGFIPDTYESVFCGEICQDPVIVFFNRKVEAVAKLTNYSNSDRKLLVIKDFKSSDIKTAYYYTSGRWQVITATRYGDFFNGASSNYYLGDIFYHDFKIFDHFGNLWRDVYGAEENEYAVNDFDNAIICNNYSVIQKEGEFLKNSPAQGVLNGVLEVEITDDVIKQELTTEDNRVYKRMCKAGSWTAWEKAVDNKMFNETLKGNMGTFGEGLAFPEMPDSVANFEMPNPYGNYPQTKHKLIYSIGSTYYVYFFFCDMTKESGNYITYSYYPSGNYGYNKFNFNGTYQKDITHVIYSGTATNIAYYNTSNMNAIQTNNNDFRLHYFDFDIYNEDATAIKFYAPSDDTIKDFNSARENGYYPISMKASELSDIANAPTFKLEGDVKGNLEVLNGVQTLHLSSHNKTFTREIGGTWKDSDNNCVLKDSICDIKVSKEVVPPDFLKSLPLDYRYFRQQDKKTIIFRRNETEYIVLRTTHANLKPYTTKNSTSTNFYLGNANQYTQVDTYNTTTKKWTTSLSTSTSNYSCTSCPNEFFEILHNDVDVYNSSNCTEIYQPVKLINFDIEKTIMNFNDAVEAGSYKVLINEGDEIANAPIEGKLEGILKTVKANGFIKQTVETTSGDTYKRFFNGSEWSEWEANVKRNEIENLLTAVPDKVQTYTYTNGDGMPEIYNWVDLNGFKIMWINVKHSEAEYNSGANGAMMKTLNFPPEAQIFNNIFMANITSYNRDNGTSTLSRVVQNAEIISNVSVRGRWRHTDNNPPKIDRFTIMCFGF